MFTAPELARIRQQLLQLQQELLDLNESGDQASAVVELDQSRVGRLSRMDALQDQAMAQEQKRRRAQELQQIAAALQRIDSGDYGYCLECGNEIASKRLEFNPSAPLCIDCAGKK